MYEALLKKCDLSKEELKVYFSLRSLGMCLPGQVCFTSGLFIRDIFPILEELYSKKLVSRVMEGDCEYYRAEPLSKLIEYISSKRGVKSKDVATFKLFIKEFEITHEDIADLDFYERHNAGGG